MNSQRMSFIIVWKVARELQRPKNITIGSNSLRLVAKAAFHSSPSLIWMLLNPQWRSRVENHFTPQRWVRTSEMRGEGVGVLYGDSIQLVVVLH